MQLHAVQHWLEKVYEVDAGCAVEDYLVTDRAMMRRLDANHPSSARERLLIHQGRGDIELSLYLDPGVVARLTGNSGTPAGFDDLCVALEGVSHFTYLCWNARYHRAVTLLELELQAEVDKYVWLRDRLVVSDDSLHRSLFERFRLDGSLADHERERYCAANHYAAKYCLGLQERYLTCHLTEGLQRELRRFYRQTQNSKIRMIDTIN